MAKMKLFSSPCDANVNNDIHHEDEDGVVGYIMLIMMMMTISTMRMKMALGDILLCLLASSSLFAYLDRKLGQGGNTRCHMMKKMMMRMIYMDLFRHRSFVFFFFHSTINKCSSKSFTSHLQLNMFLFPQSTTTYSLGTSARKSRHRVYERPFCHLGRFRKFQFSIRENLSFDRNTIS